MARGNDSDHIGHNHVADDGHDVVTEMNLYQHTGNKKCNDNHDNTGDKGHSTDDEVE